MRSADGSPAAGDRALADWASSGAMWLTGRPAGPPLRSAGDPVGLLTDQLAALTRTARIRTGSAPRLPGPELLGERAALSGLTRNGPASCGGSFRLLPTMDGHLGLSLTRAEDVDLVPALIESESARAEGEVATHEQWRHLTAWARAGTTAQAVHRARLLGLAAAGVPESSGGDPVGPTPAQAPARIVHRGGSRAPTERPVVVDFSGLWAGPLCAQLLGVCGAQVVKVESAARPDGARRGDPRFYDVLHAGHGAVVVHPEEDRDLERLQRLIDRSDLVIEASRPRALRRWGLDAERIVDSGTSWISITAHSRADDTIGYGDDVAADAGLLAWDDQGPAPCGDAIADPLTGVVAAASASAALNAVSAELIEVSMWRTARVAATRPPMTGRAEAAGGGRWLARDENGRRHVVRPPVARRSDRRAHPTGADTRRWLP